VRINVLAFARVREILGSNETDMELPGASTVRDLWNILAERHGDLTRFESSIRFARNGTIVQPQTQLHDGDEVALLPPVSGG
jgi:molybdopterin converting factor subunit 1